ncbi:Steroid 5-alpha reductase family enzyme [Acidiphilium rubrum]|uniref:Steroid 5-alpha reductase family enzyme n=2 Tax=Acidocellaceae TaxID=3385905 RepID=A0A8G2CMX1_ACIRU|nr:Steroid 5-alpha reductase family enzyme [Acidiphilium rubrum]
MNVKPMPYLILAIVLLVFLALVMAGAWAAQKRTRNSGWVDAFWTFGTGIAGAIGALVPIGPAPVGRRLLVAVLVLLWAARLGGYIVQRTRAITHEDARYARFRAEWGAAFESRMFWLLMIQAVVAWLLALCVMTAANNPHPLSFGWTLAGLAVFAISIGGEALADRQMHAFRADRSNKGKVCEAGLWGWSRHPNYFFEFLIWLSYPLIALAGLWWPGLLALIGPVFMYVLLDKISGVPPLEREMVESRGAAYRDYQARVSPMIPLPPKRQ